MVVGAIGPPCLANSAESQPRVAGLDWGGGRGVGCLGSDLAESRVCSGPRLAQLGIPDPCLSIVDHSSVGSSVGSSSVVSGEVSLSVSTEVSSS